MSDRVTDWLRQLGLGQYAEAFAKNAVDENILPGLEDSDLVERWSEVEIVVRGDSGFCREELMCWYETNDVAYVLGLAKNARLERALAPAMAQAKQRYFETGEAARVYEEFAYKTIKSWSRERRVIGKAEYLAKGANPRFVDTSLLEKEVGAKVLCEQLYCARGDMENRIKEQQLAMFADRTSSATMRANQIRLYFSSFAHVLMAALRRLGLAGTELAKAQCDTNRVKLLKIGAQIRITVRRLWISLSESYPFAALFRQVYQKLQRIPLRY